MKLFQLIQGLEIEEFFGRVEQEVRGISYDSRRVQSGDLFVAIRGTQADGHAFIDEAIKRGAVCVVVEHLSDEIKKKAVSIIKVKDSRKALSKIALNFYTPPLSRLHIIGITGTNGKTTTSYLIESILKHAGKNPGVIGTINYRYSNRELPADVTTPDPVELMRILKEMGSSNVDYVIMEVSSHSLDQDRVIDCPFEVAVFTNLTRDHLDYHGSIEDYFNAKKKLFTEYKPKCSVINRDDPFGRLLLEKIKGEYLTYGIREADVSVRKAEIDEDGIKADIMLPKGKDVSIKSYLIGSFNLYNILAATSVCYWLGIDPFFIEQGVFNLRKVPGRMELLKGGSAQVIIDYAHTPDALLKLLNTVRSVFKKRIITVFGCGGDRDKGKRAQMGEIAARFSDFLVITSDNPRSEDPLAIIKQIEEGVKKVGKKKYIVEEDRKEAIRKAIEMCEKGDVVVIAGKGHENYQIIGNRRILFEDKSVAEEFLKRDDLS